MTESRNFSASRVTGAVRNRATPIRGFTPGQLVSWIEQWRQGNLRSLALLWEELEDRDATIKGVAAKRKRSASRSPWEVIAQDDSPEAKEQRSFLEDFYQRLSASSVLEQDTTGGIALLLRQMMDAVGKRYSVHEIIWRPSRDGRLSAHLIHCPVWFFENRTGRLRFLTQDYQIDGVEMRDREWMVTLGDGLMMATAITWAAKDLAWKDWLNHCERFGQPIVDAATDATEGTEEWDSLKKAVANLVADGFLLRNHAASITLLESKGSDLLPQAALVDMAKRAIASLWRGGDLSTLSSGQGQGQGASLQGAEASDLTADDCEVLTETLNQRLDLPALQWKFGIGVRPLARIRVRPTSHRGDYTDLAIDRFLLQSGFPVGIADSAERYGRVVAGADEKRLRVVVEEGGDPGSSQGNAASLANGPRQSSADAPSRPLDRGIVADVSEARKGAIRSAFGRARQAHSAPGLSVRQPGTSETSPSLVASIASSRTAGSEGPGRMNFPHTPAATPTAVGQNPSPQLRKVSMISPWCPTGRNRTAR